MENVIRGNETLASDPTTPGQLRFGPRLCGLLLLCSLVGCSQEHYGCQPDLTQRVLAPPNLDLPADLPTPRKTVQVAYVGTEPREEHPRSYIATVSDNRGTQVSAQESAADSEPAQTLTLADAIETAFRQQPRLRVYLESVEQAQRGEDIAFAPFLPMAVAGYSVGGFDLNVGGNSTPLGHPSRFHVPSRPGINSHWAEHQHRLRAGRPEAAVADL